MNALEASIYGEEVYMSVDRTVVVLNKSWSEVSNEEQVLLQKILAAVGLKPESITVRYEGQTDVHQWQPLSSKALYFGSPMAGFPHFETVPLPNGVQLLSSPPLVELQNDSGSKQKLWQALKQLFKS